MISALWAVGLVNPIWRPDRRPNAGSPARRLAEAVERLKHPEDALIVSGGSEQPSSVRFVPALVSRGVIRTTACSPDIQRASDKNIVDDSRGDHEYDEGPQYEISRHLMS